MFGDFSHDQDRDRRAVFPSEPNTRPGLYQHQGMSMLDYYAGQALTGLLANSGPEQPAFVGVEECMDYYAKLSFAYARAMLRARGGTNAE